MILNVRRTFLFFLASCDPLPVLSNGEVSNQNSNHDALVSFSCNEGFQLKGPRQIMCINGEWKPSPPTCEGLSLSHI